MYFSQTHKVTFLAALKLAIQLVVLVLQVHITLFPPELKDY